MSNIIIFGVETFAEQLYDFMQEGNQKVAGFCIDSAYMPDYKKKYGLPVVPYEDLEKYFSPDEYGIIFAIGYSQMNKLRKDHIEDAKRRGYNIESYIHPSAIVNAEKMGYGNIVMEGVIIGQGVCVGNGNVFWPDSHVAHHTIVGDYNFFTISSVVAGNVNVSNQCVFGANCTVKNSLSIAEGTLVGAGAYLSQSTEPWSVYVPARSYKLEGKSSLDFKL